MLTILIWSVHTTYKYWDVTLYVQLFYVNQKILKMFKEMEMLTTLISSLYIIYVHQIVTLCSTIIYN